MWPFSSRPSSSSSASVSGRAASEPSTSSKGAEIPTVRSSDPLRSFKFHVDITAGPKGGQLLQAGFAAVSGIGAVNQPWSYQEGGFNSAPHQLPGQGAYTPITCSRGVLVGSHDEIYQWYRNCIAIGGSNAGAFFATSCVISVAEHPGSNFVPKLVFNVMYAWCSALQFSELDARSNVNLVESMVISHLGWTAAFS